MSVTRIISVALLASTLGSLTACHTQYNTDILAPPKGKGTEYPCGYSMFACGSACCDNETQRCAAPNHCQEASYDPPYLPAMGAESPDAGQRIKDRRLQNQRDIESLPVIQ